MLIILILTVLLIVIAIFLFVYVKWNETYWERRGLFTHHGKDRTAVMTYRLLKEKGLKHGAYICFLRPCYMPVDLNILKNILVKDADNFIHRGLYCNPKDDPLSGVLPHLDNPHQWKYQRSVITPVFSSAKLKGIFSILNDHAQIMVKVIEKVANSNQPVEARQLARQYGMDGIGSCTFGFQINTLSGENTEFQEIITLITAVNWRFILEHAVSPEILKRFRFRRYDPIVENYFRNLVNEVSEHRENNNVQSDDIFQYLDGITDKAALGDDIPKNKKLNREQMFLQLFTFFIGGFETSSSVISFTLFELARNQDIQDKLRDNIRQNLKIHGKMTYEAVKDMEYLNWVVQESLRMHSPVAYTIRICNKTYKVPDTDIILQPGESVAIPILGIQMDPEYYPNPEKFNPKHFSPENKARRHPMTFLAFGDGPRNCVGYRLGMILSSVAIAAIIGKFRVTLNEKTRFPFKYSERAVFLEMEGGIWVNFSEV